MNQIILGMPMFILHISLFVFTVIILTISNDIFTLLILGLILCIILALNIIFNDCPISTIEEYYLNTTMVEEIRRFNGLDTKSSRQSIALQWLFFSLMLVLIKLLILIFKDNTKKYICT